ncbi:MAG: hypothetical protein ACFFE8_17075 [Candidatus Heimdallarchaeota archaeon]
MMVSKRTILSVFIILIVVVIFVFVSYVALMLSIFGGPKVYIGTVTKTIPDNYSNVILSICHTTGSGSIQMAPRGVDYALSVEVDAFRDSGYNLSWVQTIGYTELTNETISVGFDDCPFVTVDPPLGWNNVRFHIREDINLSLEIWAGGDGSNITLQNLTISNLKLNYGYSFKEHFTSFSNVVFNSSAPLTFHSEAASQFELNNNQYTSNFTIWDIELESRFRHTNFDVIQLIPPNPRPSTQHYRIDSNGQTLVINLLLNQSFGVKIDVITESGFIQLPNNLTAYNSPNYEVADVKYVFMVNSTSGNVTFNLLDSV